MIGRLFSTGVENNNNDEGVHLLDPVHSDLELNQVVVEREAKGIQISAPQNPLQHKRLIDKLQECIDILESAKQQSVDLERHLRRKGMSLKVYVLMGIASAMALQGLPISMFFAFTNRFLDKLVPLDHELGVLKKNSTSLQGTVNYYMDIFNIFSDEIGDAYNQDSLNTYNDRQGWNIPSCLEVAINWMNSNFHPVDHEYFCSHPVEQCRIQDYMHANSPFANEYAYCDELQNNLCLDGKNALPAIEAQLNVSYSDNCLKLMNLQDQLNILESEIDGVNSQIEGLKSDCNYGYLLASCLLTLTAILGSIGAVYGLVKYDRARAANNDKFQNIDDPLSVIDDPSDLNKLLNMADRFGLDITNMKIDSLQAAFVAEKAEIDAKWKQRLAFLSGKKNPQAPISLLFTGTKDPVKMIMRYADLVPERAMKL
jgi:hypothetical protein